MTASTGTTSASAPAPLPRVAAVRYVTPLREGGSVPALVEADDGKLYVVKMRGAGQGARVLIAELIAGRLGQALGLRVPALALVDVDAALARSEPDTEIQDILRASAGAEPGPGPPRRRADLRPGRAPAARRRRRVARGAARHVHHQRRPHRAQPESAVVARRAGADRSRRRALLAARLGRQPGGGAARARVSAGARPRALALGGRARRRRARWRRARSPTSWSTASPPRSPTSGWRRCRAPPTPTAQRRAYADWLRARRAAIPALIEEAARARAPRV